MPAFRLSADNVFPDPSLAQADGLLAIGGDLRPARLLAAYSHGIFPWYSPCDPILWWSPVPRLVIFPERFHLPRRLKRTIDSKRFTVTADTAFAEVIAACATASGRGTQGTWLTNEMQCAYIQLHRLGYAHSIECWQQERLVGGLYGLCLDEVFFGESMFSHERDASKVALAALVQYSRRAALALIDCQMTTQHLLRFGACELNRESFQTLLAAHIHSCLPQPPWHL